MSALLGQARGLRAVGGRLRAGAARAGRAAGGLRRGRVRGMRRRRRRGISASELRGFKKVSNLLADFGMAPRGLHRARRFRRRSRFGRRRVGDPFPPNVEVDEDQGDPEDDDDEEE